MISVPRDYFHPSSTAITYTVLTCILSVRAISVVLRFEFELLSFCQILFSRTYDKKHTLDFLESERHIESIMSL